MGSLRKIFTEKTLSIEDLSYLSKLLETDLSLNECFILLKNSRNEKIFSEIRKKLDEGSLIEKVIQDYLPKQIRPYVVSLLNSLSFSSSLSISLRFCRNNEEGKRRLMNSLAYPLILLFISITSLYLFDLYGIDSIFALIGTFHADLGIYKDMRLLFRIFVKAFYYGVLILFAMLVAFSRPGRIAFLYIFLSRHFPNSFLSIFYSEEFMSLLLICMEHGYSTRESLSILKAMKSKPIVSLLAFRMDESLMEGRTLKEAATDRFYDSSLARFIKIANHTNDFSSVIESYIFLAKEKIAVRMRAYSLTIQILTYLFIGAVVIFIYQILFMPMQAISSF